MKKLMPLVGSLALAAMLLATTALAAEVPAFTDVKDGDWFKSSVEYVCEKGMMKGVSDTAFAPNDATTRAMVVTILHRLEGEPDAQAASFTDVDQSQWYAKAVNWAASNGIVKGTSETTFAPGAEITREQIATILYRYAGQKGYDTPAAGDLTVFADSADLGSYAVEAMKWAVGQGLINGTSSSSLSPKSGATRAQTAAVLMRLDQKLAESASGESFTVTFHPNYASAADATQAVKSGAAVSQPTAPVRDGYTFDGWYTAASGGEKYDFSQPVTGALELYARWTEDAAGAGGAGGGGAGGGGGGVGGGEPADPSKPHTQEEIDEEELMVSYMLEMVGGYNRESPNIKDAEVKSCLDLLIETVQKAIQAHNRGDFIDEAYINDHYSDAIKTVKQQYKAFDKEQRNEFINIAGGLALYDHLTAVMSYFGVSSNI